MNLFDIAIVETPDESRVVVRFHEAPSSELPVQPRTLPSSLDGPIPNAYLIGPNGQEWPADGRSAGKSPGEPYELVYGFPHAAMAEATAVDIRGTFLNGSQIGLRIPFA